MSDEYLINFTPQETRVALMQQGVVQEVHVERTASRGIVGNIYLGKVVRVLPGMQSAFMDVGLERTAFLHVADIWTDRHTGDAPRPIERILAEGQNLMVQVLKDPIGTKGARLSTQISIAGRMLVYLPQDKHIGISQRIGDEAGREALRERVSRLLPPDEKGGYIVRTMAEYATDEELAADIAYLRKLWAEIRNRTVGAFPPTVLYQDLNLAQRVMRDFVTDATSRIVADSRENFQKLMAFAAEEAFNGLSCSLAQLAVIEQFLHRFGDRLVVGAFGAEGLQIVEAARIEQAQARKVAIQSQLLRGGGEQQNTRDLTGQLLDQPVFRAGHFRVPDQMMRFVDHQQIPAGLQRGLLSALMAFEPVQ